MRRTRTRTVLVPVPAQVCLAFDAARGWHLLPSPPQWWLEEQEGLLHEAERLEGGAPAQTPNRVHHTKTGTLPR